MAKKRAQPKWKRDGFSSYRQYLNARYRALGFRSYSEYSSKRKAGEVPSTRGLPKAAPRTAIPHYDIKKRALPDVAGMRRESFESLCPFRYDITQQVGDMIRTWLTAFLSDLERVYGSTVYSASYRIFGHVAHNIDETGKPEFDSKEWEEWSSHMDFDKMRNELLSLAAAYGNHDFIEYGRQIGRGTGSLVFALLITRVRVSLVFLTEKGTQ